MEKKVVQKAKQTARKEAKKAVKATVPARPSTRGRGQSRGRRGGLVRQKVNVPANSNFVTTNNFGMRYGSTRNGTGITVGGEDVFCKVTLPPDVKAGYIACKIRLSPLFFGPRIANFASNFTQYEPAMCIATYQNASSYNERGTFAACMFYDASQEIGEEKQTAPEMAVRTITSAAHSVSFPPYAVAACRYDNREAVKKQFYVNATEDPNLWQFAVFYLIVDIPPDGIPDSGRTYGRVYIKYSFKFFVDSLSPPTTLKGVAAAKSNITTVSKPMADIVETFSKPLVAAQSDVQFRPLTASDGPDWVPEKHVALMPPIEQKRYMLATHVNKQPNNTVGVGIYLKDALLDAVDLIPGAGLFKAAAKFLIRVIGSSPKMQALSQATDASAIRTESQLTAMPSNEESNLVNSYLDEANVTKYESGVIFYDFTELMIRLYNRTLENLEGADHLEVRCIDWK